jgi:hypothetical protein
MKRNSGHILPVLCLLGALSCTSPKPHRDIDTNNTGGSASANTNREPYLAALNDRVQESAAPAERSLGNAAIDREKEHSIRSQNREKNFSQDDMSDTVIEPRVAARKSIGKTSRAMGKISRKFSWASHKHRSFHRGKAKKFK